MRRFYRQVEVECQGDAHRVLLDGRPVRTPAKRALTLPTAALASALAAEWRDQGETIEPATMPLTRLASTAQDRLPDLRAAALAELAAYAETDLLCYRAAAPPELVERQGQTWQPLLDWAAGTYGARLAVTTSILPIAQPRPAVRRLWAVAEALDDWPLVGLHAAAPINGRGRAS